MANTKAMSPLDALPVSLPMAPISSEVDAVAVSKTFQQNLGNLKPEDFTSDAVWRDTFALTGTLRTFYGPESICKAYQNTTESLGLNKFALDVQSAMVFRAGPAAWIQAFFMFETRGPPATVCQAIVSLVPTENGEWRIWMLRTVLEELKGQGSVDILEKAQDVSLKTDSDTDFDCVVVGGGQAGLSVGGRLHALGLSYVVLDENEEVGDSWKKRYDSCKLHLPKHTAHLPFEKTFAPSEYPEYLTKDDLSQGYRDWVKKYHINVWPRSKLQSGEWDSIKNRWSLSIGPSEGSLRKVTASQVIMAVGAGGRAPAMPSYPNKEVFGGTVLHSSNYKNAEAWKGAHGVVVGSANTGHDIAEDMVNAGLASVTMVQRSPTYVLPAEYPKEILEMTYNTTFPTDLADKLSSTLPNGVLSRLIGGFLSHKASLEPGRYDALEKAGFKLDRQGNLAHHVLIRYGGHCVDVGSCNKIGDGLIKIKSDSRLSQFTTDGLGFEDGSTLKADVIVFATGFGTNMKDEVRQIFGEGVADVTGDCKGIDLEGEKTGSWKPGGHPAFWYQGGDTAQARYMSRFIALSIKATMLGTPLKVYKQ